MRIGTRPWIMKRLRSFAHDERGATAIEYGLIAALIAVVIIAGVSQLGTKLNAKFIAISNNLN